MTRAIFVLDTVERTQFAKRLKIPATLCRIVMDNPDTIFVLNIFTRFSVAIRPPELTGVSTGCGKTCVEIDNTVPINITRRRERIAYAYSIGHTVRFNTIFSGKHRIIG